MEHSPESLKKETEDQQDLSSDKDLIMNQLLNSSSSNSIATQLLTNNDFTEPQSQVEQVPVEPDQTQQNTQKIDENNLNQDESLKEESTEEEKKGGIENSQNQEAHPTPTFEDGKIVTSDPQKDSSPKEQEVGESEDQKEENSKKITMLKKLECLPQQDEETKAQEISKEAELEISPK